MILLIDNYDSFVYNLARYLQELGCDTRVVRNDRIGVDEVRALKPAAVVLSPGPGAPQDAGVCIELVRKLGTGVPMLGVCLGHQAIAAAYGAAVVRAAEPVHGRTSLIQHDSNGLFAGLPNPLRATRYHSLIVAEATLPPDLVVTAYAASVVPDVGNGLCAVPPTAGKRTATDGGPYTIRGAGHRTPPAPRGANCTDLIMAIEHRTRPVFGVQFHPESVLTQFGHHLLANFLSLSGIPFSGTESAELIEPPQDPSWLIDKLPANVPLHW